jgi:acyl dehydratase
MSTTSDRHVGAITDEGLASMRENIGVESSLEMVWNNEARYDAVWHFALGVGDDNPLWWDRDYAVSGPVGRMFAPPAFLYSLTHEVTLPGKVARQSDVDWLPGVGGLWAGDRWVWHSRVWMDERYVVKHQLSEVRERDGNFAGRSVVQTDKFTFCDTKDQVVAELYRNVIRFDRDEGMKRASYLDTPIPKYSASQMQDLEAQYAQEPVARRGAQPRYFEDVNTGDEMPTLVKGPLTMTSLVGWLLGSGATQCPASRMLYQWFAQHPEGRLHKPSMGFDDTLEGGHWDEELANLAGMPRGYDFGSQRITSASHVATDWCGDEGELVALDARLRKPNFLGDTTWFAGRVIGKERSDDRALVTCEITGTNQRGEMTTTATAKIALPTRRS